MNTGYANPYVVSQAAPNVRAEFIQKTYLHLAGAIVAFVAIEALLFSALSEQQLIGITLAMTQGFNWLLVMGAFVVAGMVANRWAMSNTSQGKQYAGLAIYVVVEALIFVPLLTLATFIAKQPELISQAGVITLALVGGITAVAFTSKMDFSFLGGIIKIGGFVAIGAIACGVLFGFDLGMWFAVAMVVLAGGSVLYTTSNMIHHYNPSQYVAASLGLFASIATVFYYVLSILLRLAQSTD